MNITVVGIGKLGLGFSLVLEKGGFNVLGIDINQIDNDQLLVLKIPFSLYLYNRKNY